MKKKTGIVLLIASYLVLFVSLYMCIFSIYDLHRVLEELAGNPGAGGMDYWGLGWGYGMSLFAASTVGLVLSLISKKLLESGMPRNFSRAATGLFLLLDVAAVILFYR